MRRIRYKAACFEDAIVSNVEEAGERTPREAASRRRTFAIISHPDAGKTTLTEHLLLMGGAIHLAGEVKAKGDRRRARSDWMKIEQERGISVTTAVMTFEYQGLVFNLLDTPGHEDFSEDTYRTLTAADSAIMVIDAAKGIESQTRKLFEVCRMRDIPIITYINKMDREARDPFSLIDEIADQLQLHVTPAMWPAGSGLNFRGAMHFESDKFLTFGRESRAIDPAQLHEVLQPEELKQMKEEMELAHGGYQRFDLATFREGHITPVYFGSALKHFGVKELIEGLGRSAPGPRSQAASERSVEPHESKVTGFVFKVQANMDPNHRDRVAFMRVCSGHFKRGMKLKQSGTGKVMSVHNPILFFAQSRETVDEAWPGDIIGIPNHGVLRVGDTLTEGENLTFTGIPNFAPEIVRRVRLADPLKAKHLQRALESLAEEGVTQVFKPRFGAQWFVGVVGQLQLEVLSSRIAAEYGLEVAFEQGMFETARWVDADDPVELKRFLDAHLGNLADDRDGSPVFLAKSAWELRYSAEKWPKIKFTATRERRH
jgi:peptide chain release factor 3